MTGPLISQPFQTKDSSLIANKDLKKAAILIEKGKAYIEELTLQRKQNNLLSQSNELKDSTIAGQLKTIHFKDMMITNYKAIDTANRQIITIKDEALKDLRKSLKCQKTQTFLASLVALASLVLLVVK